MENWLRKRARLSPAREALRCDGATLTFAELWHQVESRAAWLAGEVSGPGRLGLLAENSVQSACWVLAGLTAGREVVLFNTRLAPAELETQMARSELALLLVGSSPQRWSATAGRALAFDDVVPPGEVAGQWPDWPDDAVATVMFTSGSSGSPKGVLQTFGNHRAAALGSLLNLGLEPGGDAWLAPTPLFHVSGLSVLLRCVLSGITCVLESSFDAERVAAQVRAGRCTVVSVVPQMLRAILPHLDTPPRRFRAFLLGGGFTEPDVIEACVARGYPVVPSFGMSETCAHVIACPPDAPIAKLRTAGQALFGTDLRIGAPGPDGVGEIQLRSPAIVAGYLDDPAGYAAAWTDDGWFRTGDAGSLDGEGYLTVRTRLGQLIVSGGENIVPAEVERVLGAHPAVAECAVVGAPDERWGFVPVAFVVSDGEPDPTVLAAHCRSGLAHYKCPRRFIRVSALPRTAIGKVDLAALARAASEDGGSHG